MLGVMSWMVLYMSLDPSDYEAHQLNGFVPYLVKIDHRLSKQGKLPCRSTPSSLDWSASITYELKHLIDNTREKNDEHNL